MKLATWNVNSVRVRLDHVLRFLKKHEPDVLCLQEIKCESSKFPSLEIMAAGYQSAVLGQPGYNGVAILSREPITQIRDGLDDQVSIDPQARAVGAVVNGIEILNLYVPNGNMVGTDKWDYKLRWMDALLETLDARYYDDDKLIVCGDLNIAPLDRDLYAPADWANSVLSHPKIREQFVRLEQWGLVDIVEPRTPDNTYTWWDYRGEGFDADAGLRIDHILTTRPLVDKVQKVWIDRETRGLEKPSDHAAVVVELKL